ncbi:SDR family oxidoreductase [soil metagenome]
MDILVIGGTVFLSRAMVEISLQRGHTVTTFSRGLTGTPVPGAHALIGDRNDPDDLAQLAGRHFDLVFDTGYFPDQVNAAAALLEPTTGHYAFVSSISAYPGWPELADYRAGGVYDGDPDAVGEQVPDDLTEAGPYGWRKVGAERAVLRAFGEHRSSIFRAGCIVGPYDGIGRLPWWLDRVGRGGQVLAPGQKSDVLRLIDARDLAAFALLRPVGTFETTAPANQINREQFLAEARRVTGSDAEFVWVPDEFLAGKVEPWTELPLWLPAAESPGLFAHHSAAAEAAGLACRPVLDTLAETWDWMGSVPGGWQPAPRTPGLDPARERELLAQYAAG